jgi:AmmeMemoRadiSam system protein A
VVSTDFTHYGKQFDYTPFADHVAERITQLDATVVSALQRQQLNPFLKIIQSTHATVCGRMPLAVFLALCERHVFGELASRLVAYATSSNAALTGSSVSYAGILFTTQQRTQQPIEDQFTMMEQQVLLDLSKATVRSLFDPSQKKFLLPIVGNAGDEKRGVFVTLYKKGELRGCIGIVEPMLPLTEGIITKTEATALHDTRFTPVTADELADITVTLSLLSVPVPIASYTNITIGKQGIILQNGLHQALFLPKVATEFGWDLNTTLTQLSKKAGLPARAWQDPQTTFSVFTSLDTPTEPVILK